LAGDVSLVAWRVAESKSRMNVGGWKRRFCGGWEWLNESESCHVRRSQTARLGRLLWVKTKSLVQFHGTMLPSPAVSACIEDQCQAYHCSPRDCWPWYHQPLENSESARYEKRSSADRIFRRPSCRPLLRDETEWKLLKFSS
jgi:hypothetical protein